jgi:hypothetical protein
MVSGRPDDRRSVAVAEGPFTAIESAPSSRIKRVLNTQSRNALAMCSVGANGEQWAAKNLFGPRSNS